MPPDTEVLDGDGRDLDGVNAAAVTARMDDLRQRWAGTAANQDAPAVETRREPAFDYDGLRASVDDGYLGGGYVWVVRDPADAPDLTESMPGWARDDDPRALLILNRGGDAWGLPGGGREDGESFEDAARREVREEVGIDCALTGCFLLRRFVVTDPDGDRPPVHFLQAFFDGAYRDGTLRVQGGELHGAAWFANPPGTLGLQPAPERRGVDFFD